MIENRKKRILILPVALMLTLFLSACTKPYVGMKANYIDPLFCTCNELPRTCITYTPAFTFDIIISKSDAPGEYVIEGGATYSGQGGFSTLRLGSAGGMQGSKFYLLLAKNGEIIDSLFLMPVGTDLDRRIAFNRKTFKSQDFDAVGIIYQIVVS